MPEYVYAQHDFLPKYEDEMSFHVGELIEVIEKDDTYGDGWWRGRNLAGSIGLFPVSYTALAPPVTDASPSPQPVSESHGISTSNGKSVLQPLTEESESEASGINIPSPVLKHLTTPPLNSDSDNDTELPHEGGASHNLANGDNEMMKTTMTDVQIAIEQLGADDVGDGARSFSFTSTRDGEDTENSDTDFDLSDFDGTVTDGNGGEDWHKTARRKLAAKAKRAVEEAERLESIMRNNKNGRRTIVPPIAVDFSDESEVEDDSDLSRSSSSHRNHSYIPEEGKNVGTDGEATAAADDIPYSVSTDVFVPPKDETDILTATKLSFSMPQTPVPTGPLPEKPEENPPPEKDIYPGPISPPTTNTPNIQQILKESSTPVREISNGLPSPVSVEHPSSKHNSITSSSSAPGMLVNTLQVQQQPNDTSVVTESGSIPVSTIVQGRNEKPPIGWSVNEVVDWLKSKGFDQNVCDKFIEQEISGDVLLELDVNLLKIEIGIMAFGRRMRIANAITDLRRLPSIEYSDHQLSPTQLHHSNSLTRSHRTMSTTVGHVHWRSFGSPGDGCDSQQSGHLQDSPVNINDDVKVAGPVGMGSGTAAGVGLGIGLSPETPKAIRSRLLLSHSNGALKESAAKTVSKVAVNGEDEERGHVSDGEIVLNSTKKRHRTFGLSHESAVSTINSFSRSKGLLSSTISLDKDKNILKGKETSDKDTSIIGIQRTPSRMSMGAKSADRLSIFGTTLGGALRKGRKPPPSEDTLTEKATKFSLLPRLHSSSIHRSSSTASHRTSTSNAPQRSPLNLNPNVTIDTNTNAPKSLNSVSSLIEHSEEANIWDRIGKPDHMGWMCKRGDKYNSWKRRYFILKGPHLYFLRNNYNSKSRIKGYILIVGYKITVDVNVDPGRYGFRIDHDHDQTHYFSSEERNVIRDWVKAIMKATISRDSARSVVSSCYIPTVPLAVAQAMNPAPRPPSPSSREAIQMALKRENTEQLTKRDTLILGLNATDVKYGVARMNSVSSKAAIAEGEGNPSSLKGSTPPRPSRQLPVGRMSSVRSVTSQTDDSLIKWANTHLPESLQINDSAGFLYTGLGLGLLRLAESIKGQPASPPVPNFAFPTDINDDNLDGIFRLFDFLLDNDVKMGSVSINDVRLGKRDKIIPLLKALKAWEDKLKAHTQKAASPSAFMLM